MDQIIIRLVIRADGARFGGSMEQTSCQLLTMEKLTYVGYIYYNATRIQATVQNIWAALLLLTIAK